MLKIDEINDKFYFYTNQDGRLRINDQIFQIGEINVRNMSSEQVASVLRQSSMQGQMIKFIVARPIHNTVGDVELVSSSGVEKIEFDANNKPIITNLNSPNSQSVVVKTSEILTDKKLNLINLIEAEIEAKKENNTTNSDKQPTPPPQPPPEIPKPVEEIVTETRIDKYDDNHVILRLSILDCNISASTWLELFNSAFKQRQLAITLDLFIQDDETNYYLVKEIEQTPPSEGVKLEICDFLVEVNGQPVSSLTTMTPQSFTDKQLVFKFRNDPSFKLQVSCFIFNIFFL